ncbi:MBL fold metallo-hydrolase [Marinilabiliaceae bacterium ANBcel2]|nr:MBL fold metallo-hydrolase [Marinilabiliaceae bacterium ANBcel2]
MKQIVVIDNNNNPHNKNLHTEHGLSIYFEVDNLKWLTDAGNSSLFIDNAKELGINIKDIDHLIISHGHKDHGGGLEKFLEINKKARVWISHHIKKSRFYSYRKSNKRDITIDKEVFNKYNSRFNFISNNIYITDHVMLVTGFTPKYPLPYANKALYKEQNNKIEKDDFLHETAVAVEESDGITVLSGCAHNGLLNTLEAVELFTTGKIKMCTGGAHLPDKEDEKSYESDEDIDKIAYTLKEKYPDMKFITGHCTGQNAIKRFKNILNNNFDSFYSGYVIPPESFEQSRCL